MTQDVLDPELVKALQSGQVKPPVALDPAIVEALKSGAVKATPVSKFDNWLPKDTSGMMTSEDLAAGPTLGQRASEAAKAVPRGVAEAVAPGVDAVGRMLHSQDPLNPLMQMRHMDAPEPLAENPRFKGLITTKVAESLGAGAPALAAGAESVAGGALVAGAQSALAALYEARSRDATPEQAYTAAALNGLVGAAVMAVPIGQIFGKTERAIGPQFRQRLVAYLTHAGLSAADMQAASTTQQWLGNVIAQSTGDWARSFMLDIDPKDVSPALLGLLMSAATQSAHLMEKAPGDVAPKGKLSEAPPLTPEALAGNSEAQATAPVASSELANASSELAKPAEAAPTTESAAATEPPLGTEAEGSAPDTAKAAAPPPVEKTTDVDVSRRILTPDTSPSVTTGGEPAPEAKPVSDAPEAEFPSAPTGIKNRLVDAELDAAGLPPATHGDRLSFQQAHDAAAELMKADPDAGKKLLASLSGNDRPLTGVEDALLVREKNRLRLERESAQRALDEARASKGDVVAAQARVEDLRNQFAATSDIQTRVGTENALGLVMRRLEIKHDYSLAGVERAVIESRGGEPLTPDLEAQIAEVHAKYAESEARYEKLIEQHKQVAADAELKAAALEAENSILRIGKERAPSHRAKAVKAKARIDELFHELAVEAGSTAGLNFGSEKSVKLIAELALRHVEAGYHTVADFAQQMVAKFGEEIRPHLQIAWDAAQKFSREQLASGIKEKLIAGDDIGRDVDKIVRDFAERGITELGPMVRAVHEVLREADPNLTLRDAHDAVTHYGKFKKLSTDEVSANVRRIRGEGREIAKLADIAERKPPKATGIEYPKAEERQRALQKQVHEGMKKLGIKTTDEATQIKSVLDSMKTRARNELSDLQYALDRGEKMVGRERVKLTDAELEDLRVQIEAKRIEYRAMIAEPEAPRVDSNEIRLQKLIDEKRAALASGELAVRGRKQGPQTETVAKLREELDVLNAQMAEARKGPRVNADEIRLQDQIDALSEKIAKGDIEAKGQKQGPLTENVARLKAQRNLLNKQLAEMRKKANAPTEADVNLRRVQAAERDVEKSIVEYDRQIAAGDLARKQGTPGPSSQKLEMLKARRDALRSELETLRRIADPKATPEQRAIKARQTRILNENARVRERLFYAEFEPPSPRQKKVQPPLTPELEAAKADTEQRRQKLSAISERERIKRLPKVQKVARALTRLSRAFVLSSPSVVEKLAAAGGFRVAARTAQEGVGKVISKVLPGFAERAPHEGGSTFETQAWTKGVIAGAKEAWANLKNKPGPRELAFGRPHVMPRTALDWLGSVHQALHQLPAQMEFERQMGKGVEWATSHGLDVSDPTVLMRIGADAYEYAQRETLLQDNKLVNAWRGALARLETPSKETGKPSLAGTAGATLGRVMVPVDTIPTNAVAEAFSYLIGDVTGSAKLALAYKRGINRLGPMDADAIGRSLKRGLVGKAAMAVAFLTYESLGGYYRGKQPRDEVPAGDARIAGIEIDQHLLHSPFIESMQFAANMRRVMDQHKNNSFSDATIASAMGLLKEAPYARETIDVGRMMDATNPGEAMSGAVGQRLVPQFSFWLARLLDKDERGHPVKRQAKGLLENVQSGIPGLREKLPKKP